MDQNLKPKGWEQFKSAFFLFPYKHVVEGKFSELLSLDILHFIS